MPIRMVSRTEAIVFGSIIVVVLLLTFLVAIPAQPSSSSLPNLGKAPELAGTQEWLNSNPLSISGLRGKVVLVDFWTYSCINCIRTLPYLESWHEKYSGKGLVIIGVHSPEFDFEKNFDNVKSAVQRFGIRYAVVQDNDHATWSAFENNYWPRKYLIDKDGYIRYDHIGEGGYEETEKAIQSLLMETGVDAGMNTTPAQGGQLQIGTPELYLGYVFSRRPLGNREGFVPEAAINYSEPEVSFPNTVYLSGQWFNSEDHVRSIKDSKLFLIYSSKDVYIVAGGSSRLSVKIDGSPITPDYYGSDSNEGTVTIGGQRLYNIISAPIAGTHTLEIDASPGLELYTFTFG